MVHINVWKLFSDSVDVAAALRDIKDAGDGERKRERERAQCRASLKRKLLQQLLFTYVVAALSLSFSPSSARPRVRQTDIPTDRPFADLRRICFHFV
jgi:hypothetical protein